mgnify:CR=1 FL=1
MMILRKVHAAEVEKINAAKVINLCSSGICIPIGGGEINELYYSNIQLVKCSAAKNGMAVGAG